jgi:hypothetical protein
MGSEFPIAPLYRPPPKLYFGPRNLAILYRRNYARLEMQAQLTHVPASNATRRTIRLYVLCLLAFCAGCEREPATTPTLDPRLAALLAEGRSNAIADHLTNGMSNEQILRAIGADPATLLSNRANGIDGYSVTYINAGTNIIITRSLSTGLSVLWLLPKDQQKHWNLDK